MKSQAKKQSATLPHSSLIKKVLSVRGGGFKSLPLRVLPLRKGESRRRVFVAMSGGVDSSVAAALLIKQGYEVIGAHMRCFNVDGCAERDAEDARRVAEQLNIPFYVFDFEDEYKARVVDYMIKGYKSGITPNPDVMCNKEIKFGLFFAKAMALGADYVAAGHYVRRFSPCHPEVAAGDRRISGPRENKRFFGPRPQNDSRTYCLYSARDSNKDQSYFLWTLTQKQLRYCLFPIGEYTKPQVRVFAKKFGLLTAGKKDSQGICFLGQVSIREFLAKYIKPKKGDILTIDGRIAGVHDGAHLYTIGQRNLGIKNMELGMKGKGDTVPYYVVAKDLKKNTITIAPENHPTLYKKEIKLANVNFIVHNYSLFTIHSSLPVLARVRYRQPLAKARLILFSNSQEFENRKISGGGTKYKLIFATPQKFVAEGQSAVFYSRKGGEMLGGGIII